MSAWEEGHGRWFFFQSLTGVTKQGGGQYVFSSLHYHRNYDDPCSVGLAKFVTGGTNEEVSQVLGQLWFASYNLSVSTLDR